MFAKFPEKGKVKTRLAKDVGDEKAVEIYEGFLRELITEHSDKGYEFITAISPADKLLAFKAMFAPPLVLSQRGDGLGERMFNAFADLLRKYDKVIIIGSDLPDLKEKTITRAFNLLDLYDVVLGPATDGGYYLIGLKALQSIFSDIDWSTEKVLSQQIRNVNQHNLTHIILEEKTDIDTLQDLLKTTLK